MHKLIKPPMATPPAVVWKEVSKKKVRVSTDQANADAQRKKRKPIWEGADKQAKPIRENDEFANDKADQNYITQGDMAQRIKEFKVCITSCSTDR